MKAAVGSMVIVACVFGVAGWLVRWHSAQGPALAADPCVLEEVACTATAAGRVVHATFPSMEASGEVAGALLLGLVVSGLLLSLYLVAAAGAPRGRRRRRRRR